MASSHEEALSELYQAPLDQFVAERKRLANALKAAGDKASAARLAAARRPPVSAWTVNQLWRSSRETFDALFAAASRLRAGDHGATRSHRDALAQLRTDALGVLARGGHAASEATLRRIASTLAGLAARGGFEPDLPGALSSDREPPGFDALDVGLATAGGAEAGGGAPAVATESGDEARGAEATSNGDIARAEQERAERERLERKRAEEERAEQERAERERAALEKRLSAALDAARRELGVAQNEVARLSSELASAEERRERSAKELARLESELTELRSHRR